MKSKPEEAFPTGISDRTVYFGHQSVGDNILSGISENTSGEVRIVKLLETEDYSSGIFHQYLGVNGDPERKISDFRTTLLNWDGNSRPDIAVMKMCYLDVDSNTDVETLFEEYQAAVDDISKNLPDTVLIHMTVPLTTRDSSLKSFIKKMLGRTPRGYSENIRREQYNALVRDTYGSDGYLFDIAVLESTRPGGKQESFSYQGNTGYSLYRGYAADSGHLNEEGRESVARQFVSLIESISE